MGFFTAIISSPRTIQLNEWLERLDINKSFKTQKVAERVDCNYFYGVQEYAG